MQSFASDADRLHTILKLATVSIASTHRSDTQRKWTRAVARAPQPAGSKCHQRWPHSCEVCLHGCSLRREPSLRRMLCQQGVILSAKYGLISPDFVIPGPYNVTFKNLSTRPIDVRTLR